MSRKAKRTYLGVSLRREVERRVDEHGNTYRKERDVLVNDSTGAELPAGDERCFRTPAPVYEQRRTLAEMMTPEIARTLPPELAAHEIVEPVPVPVPTPVTADEFAAVERRAESRAARQAGAETARALRPATEARDRALAEFGRSHPGQSAQRIRWRLQTNAAERHRVLGPAATPEGVPSAQTIQRAIRKFRVT